MRTAVLLGLWGLVVLCAVATATPTPSSSLFNKKDGTGCSCIGHECGCCAHVEVKSLGLNDTACLNITAIPATLSLSLTLTLDGQVIINKTVSLMEPNICAPIPYLDELVDVCLEFYDMQYSTQNISGCVKLALEVFGYDVAEVDLGCFDIPLALTEEEIAKMRKLKLLEIQKQQQQQVILN